VGICHSFFGVTTAIKLNFMKTVSLAEGIGDNFQSDHSMDSPKSGENTAFDTLKMHLASGEITTDEFNEMKKAIEG
jgi:uncharacterized membrane protein